MKGDNKCSSDNNMVFLGILNMTTKMRPQSRTRHYLVQNVRLHKLYRVIELETPTHETIHDIIKREISKRENPSMLKEVTPSRFFKACR